ncbi:MAG: DUF1508 domain-containing protein [Herminiimonas sp.]|uniref:DUF1508 domain-containing protein n=1 Tax=Herminiimonas sp. TaxID=1926289 RepID=UPI0027174DE3|nr:DUF1508 domain-containing protein [Herminiimonas sp.]MDO9421077.1 DUF1508 domain-containing protein [Herminiimonas sp.]
MYFERYEQTALDDPLAASQGKYRWRFWANGKIIFTSAEGYHDKDDRERSLEIARATNFLTPVVDAPVNKGSDNLDAVGLISSASDHPLTIMLDGPVLGLFEGFGKADK